VTKPAKVARAAWIVGCLSWLVYCQLIFDGKPNSDVEMLLTYWLFLAAFPTSILAVATLIISLMVGTWMRGTYFTTTRWLLIYEWLVLAAFGYSQWFVLLPYLLRIRRRWQLRSD
jgi:hypothetical protein